MFDFITFRWAWDRYSFTIALIVGAFIMAGNMKRRKGFSLRVTLCCIFMALFVVFWDLFIKKLVPSDHLYLFQFILVIIVVYICFDCNIWASMFAATSSYCMQHIAQRAQVLLKTLFWRDMPYWVAAVILFTLTALIFYLVYIFIVRKYRAALSDIVVDSKVQIVAAIFGVASMIILNGKIMGCIDRSDPVKLMTGRICVHTFSIMCAILLLILQFTVIISKRYESDNQKLQNILREKKDQYEYEKSLIDIVNVKYHDMKHMLYYPLGAKECAEQTKDAIELYDEMFNTGNEALDVILTRKAYICKKKNIRFTCMADGEKLMFMKDIDVYTLFGNILDNAIEAAEKINDVEKHVVGVNITAKDYFVQIRVTNYFTGEISVNEGLISTTKQDKLSHGFGMRSIRIIVEKYGGDIRIETENDLFILSLMFPV